jgi:dTDP-4-dehydrorhamnose 3,5-epimerase
MNIRRTSIPEVLVLEPSAFGDARGCFFESWNQRTFDEAIGQSITFVQDNHSVSARSVLRGLHYQLRHPQGKLVRVVRGAVFDVAVDLRRNSPTLGRWVGEELSAANRRQLWIPEGFAHGFLVLSAEAEFLYKTTEYWYRDDERCIRWDDPELAIGWPLEGARPVISAKDTQGSRFSEARLVEPIGAMK